MKTRVGVSSCLLGCRVRYNGADKYDPLITGLREHCELIPVCPETECGMGVPREPMSFVDGRLITNTTGRDLTSMMTEWTAQKLDALENTGLSLFIFKSKSPSCGAEGIFRREFCRRFPKCRVVDEVEFNRDYEKIIHSLINDNNL